jgi:hypothetical protein
VSKNLFQTPAVVFAGSLALVLDGKVGLAAPPPRPQSTMPANRVDVEIAAGDSVTIHEPTERTALRALVARLRFGSNTRRSAFTTTCVETSVHD